MSEKNEKPDESRQFGLGTWMSIGSPIITELVSEFSFDWLLFDLEHGCMQESYVLSNFQAVSRKDLKLIVRIGSLDPALIARVLDWGATGIMMPHVTSSSQAIACINAMRYPPFGQRGYSGSARVYNYGLRRPDDPHKVLVTSLMVQIEDLEGVKNADDIAAIEGVDVLFIGPSDLKHELSTHSGKDAIDYNYALQSVSKAAHKNNKQVGILVQDTSNMQELIQYGFSCFAISSDLDLINRGYQVIVSESEKLLKNNNK